MELTGSPDYEGLSVLLSEYLELASGRAPLPSRAGDAAADADLRLIAQSIDDQMATSGQHVVDAALGWWEEFQSERDNDRRWRALHVLFSRVNSRLEGEEFRVHYVSRGVLLLGDRWWRSWGRASVAAVNAERPQGSKIQYVPPANSRRSFPYVRLASIRSHEWIERESITRAFEACLDEGVLRIGLCALGGESRTKFAGTRALPTEIGGGYGFVASRLKAEPNASISYLDELRRAVRWAREKAVHVLCFPELSVCQEGLDALRDEISRTASPSDSADGHALALVLPGSFHREIPGQSHRSNSAPVWTVNSDVVTRVAEYHKDEPFSYPTTATRSGNALYEVAEVANRTGAERLVEDIVGLSGGSRLPEVRLIRTPLGVFGVMVCKDSLTSDHLKQTYKATADHLCILALNSAAEAWYDAFAQEAVSTEPLATYLTNATQAVSEGDQAIDVAFASIPRGAEEKLFMRFLRSAPPPIKGDKTIKAELPPDGLVHIEIAIPITLAAF